MIQERHRLAVPCFLNKFRSLDCSMRIKYIPLLRKSLITGALLSTLLLGACATVGLKSGQTSGNGQQEASDNVHRLTGTWLAIDKNGDLRAGTIAFEPNGVVIIAPNGSQPLIGSWKASAHQILISLAHNGLSTLTYRFSPRKPVVLTITFKNGTYKNFARLPVNKDLPHENAALHPSSAGTVR